MRLFGALGGLDDAELRATFNGGLGMIAVVPAADVALAIATLAEHGHRGRASSARSSTPSADGGAALRRGAARDRRRERRPARIAVAVSGAGSNLRALHAAAVRGELGGAIVLVFADRACPALDWAAEQGIDTALVPGGDDDALAEVARRAPGRTSSCWPATCG